MSVACTTMEMNARRQALARVAESPVLQLRMRTVRSTDDYREIALALGCMPPPVETAYRRLMAAETAASRLGKVARDHAVGLATAKDVADACHDCLLAAGDARAAYAHMLDAYEVAP